MNALRALPCILLSLVAGCVSHIPEEDSQCPCGDGWECCYDTCIREGEMCLNAEQKLLVALEGKWIGTASEASTMSGSTRIIMEMTLPLTGEPTLEGLTGSIWFGEELDTSSVDPEFPRLDEGAYYLDIRDGFIFTLLNMDILDGRLLAEFEKTEQWKEFCEAQTVTYDIGGDIHRCVPGGDEWWIEEASGPNGEPGYLYHGPNGEEVFVSKSKQEICFLVCTCDVSGCTVDVDRGPHDGGLDLSVDMESGVIIGTGSEGQITVAKQ